MSGNTRGTVPAWRGRTSFPKPVRVGSALVELFGDEELKGALCKGHAPLFDATIPGESLAEQAERLDQAREMCGQCPVRAACEAAGRASRAATGVWGGRVTQPRRERRAGSA